MATSTPIPDEAPKRIIVTAHGNTFWAPDLPDFVRKDEFAYPLTIYTPTRVIPYGAPLED